MKLSYLAQQTRPDIAFAVNILAKFQIDAREHDKKALERILRYVRGTWDFGIHYVHTGKPATLITNNLRILNDAWHQWKVTPEGYADASYTQEIGRKSRNGYCFMMCGGAIDWFSKQQTVVALSSTEAEYISLSEAVKNALWYKHLLCELGFTINDPTLIHQDNQSTIAIAMNPINHKNVKHIDTKVHFLRDHLKKQDVRIAYCPTEEWLQIF